MKNGKMKVSKKKKGYDDEEQKDECQKKKIVMMMMMTAIILSISNAEQYKPSLIMVSTLPSST